LLEILKQYLSDKILCGRRLPGTGRMIKAVIGFSDEGVTGIQARCGNHLIHDQIDRQCRHVCLHLHGKGQTPGSGRWRIIQRGCAKGVIFH